MNKNVFREYDIRGIVGVDLIVDEIYQLAQAIGYNIIQKNPQARTILIGQDGRESSPAIATEMIRGFQDAGFSVVHCGLVPSPVVYFGSQTHNFDAACIVTASHNPAEYNGVKIVINNKCLWGNEIQEIAKLFEQKKSVCIGEKREVQTIDLISEYITYLVDQFQHLKNKSMPIVFECAYATAGAVIPQLVDAFGWTDSIILHAEIGKDRSYSADPTVEKNMQPVKTALTQTTMRYGIGFDGDADRMSAMTKTGYLLSGDELLALFINSISTTTKGLTAVCNITMSQSLVDLCKNLQVTLKMVPTGHAIVKEKMDELKASVAGEGSCHFFFKDRYFGFDDGIYAA